MVTGICKTRYVRRSGGCNGLSKLWSVSPGAVEALVDSIREDLDFSWDDHPGHYQHHRPNLRSDRRGYLVGIVLY
ncbi:MAG: hypothetical protein WD625_06295 [Balneolales bacterium]